MQAGVRVAVIESFDPVAAGPVLHVPFPSLSCEQPITDRAVGDVSHDRGCTAHACDFVQHVTGPDKGFVAGCSKAQPETPCGRWRPDVRTRVAGSDSNERTPTTPSTSHGVVPPTRPTATHVADVTTCRRTRASRSGATRRAAGTPTVPTAPTSPERRRRDRGPTHHALIDRRRCRNRRAGSPSGDPARLSRRRRQG